MLAIKSSNDGHFNNYIDIIRTVEKNLEDIVYHKGVFSSLSIAKVVIKRKHNEILFLHGEHSLFLCVFLKIIFPFKKFTALFYYGFSVRKRKYTLVYKFLIKVLTFMKIDLCYLEGSNKLLDKSILKHFRIIKDPVLLSGYDFFSINATIPTENSEVYNFLIAGYIDDRKLVPTIVKALDFLSQRIALKIQLTLLGKQKDSVNIFLNSYDTSQNFNILSNNNRYSDEELVTSMLQAHCVLALYDNHWGSSGIVLNAIALNRHVIFYPVGVLEEFARALDITSLPTQNDFNSLIYSLETIIRSKKQYSHNNRICFLKQHTENNFIDLIKG